MVVRDGAFPYYSWSSTDPSYDGAFPQGGVLAAPTLDNAYNIGVDRKIRIDFSGEMEATNPAGPNDVLNPANYVFGGTGSAITAGSITVHQVSPTIVEITTNEEMQNGGFYTVTVNNVVSATGTPIDPGSNSDSFPGFGVAPTVSSLSYALTKILTVEFSEEMLANVDLTAPGSYAINGPTGVDIATAVNKTQTNPTIVEVEFPDELLDGGAYTFFAGGTLQDLATNNLSPGSYAFTGAGTPPEVQGAQEVSGTEVRIIFNEAVQGGPAQVSGNYSIQDLTTLHTLSIVSVVQESATDYLITTAQQASGANYRITCNSNILDLAGNALVAPNNTADFTGVGISPPLLRMIPPDDTVGTNPRTPVVINAYDDTFEFSGVAAGSLDVKFTFTDLSGNTREEWAIEDGVYNPNYIGAITGSETDDEGIYASILPKSEHWLPVTRYRIYAYIEDLEAVPTGSSGFFEFQTGPYVCFEDKEVALTAADTALMTPITGNRHAEQIRWILFERASKSPRKIDRTRAMMRLATLIELKGSLAGILDFSLVDAVTLCDTTPVRDVYTALVNYRRALQFAIQSSTKFSKPAQDLLLSYADSASPVTFVATAAIVVALEALTTG